jgi:molybdenum cofactor biosynthesis protein B
MGHAEHKANAPSSVGCMVITVSDTRTPDTDESGRLIQKLLREQDHSIVAYHLVKNEPSLIKGLIQKAPAGVQAIILTGGTGLSKRDSTYETLVALFEKKLDGFGELFRALSYREIGSPAMMSRATAGTYQGKVIFSLPGSEAAVRLAMEKLILPELGHLLHELTR